MGRKLKKLSDDEYELDDDLPVTLSEAELDRIAARVLTQQRDARAVHEAEVHRVEEAERLAVEAEAKDKPKKEKVHVKEEDPPKPDPESFTFWPPPIGW